MIKYRPPPLQGSRLTTVVMEPTSGLASTTADVNLPAGFTPDSENFILREGALEMRPMLARYGGNPLMVSVTGGAEITSVAGLRYPLISGTSRLAYHTGTAWSVLSYVSAYGVNDPPAGTNVDYWDMTQIYWPDTDENLAVAANGSYQSLYVWKSGTSVFSSLTGAPRATKVAAFDNYLVTLNQTDANAGGQLVQRVQWSDRGSASSWTGGLSGYEDLLDMKGYGTRLIPQETRLVIFSDQEIWQATAGAGPFIFQFTPIDRATGCPYPWTITAAPMGLLFLSRDLQVYLLPKGGGPAVKVSNRVHKDLRTTIDKPDRAWGVYDPMTSQYQLYYAALGGTGRPQRALYLDVESGSWAKQAFDRAGSGLAVSMGFVSTIASSGTSWGGAGAAGLTWANVGNRSWGQMSGTSDQRSVLVGTSAGTMYQLNSTATSDDGVSVPAKWQMVVGGDDHSRLKTLSRVRIDYTADSASSVTVRVSQTMGATFEEGVGLSLPSGAGQAVADCYVHTRYPVVEFQVEGTKPRIERAFAEYRPGGR